ncbi:hypothetical protein BCV69DRAFT_132932 [Microstroma glucosiphilum]|uniref:Ubiquitin-like domain-containing protein n=1 Tax=Pseudomicrostroma glucosiphilum TaxID=1684307 RepID=A0A316UCD0_9BASI|nr:hypothetical protein BCV69DRAFT_132932 [Pseudomicrostroma glucosiphilum]PWN22111.1 hypothetical protein BCV69DRAFT_132932 [Pseudomicrostroma glucosiphilum]
MTSPRPAPASHKLPLYIRNVSCDQWIRLSIDSSSTVAMLKDKALDRLGIGDEEADLHFDITRLHSDNKVTGTALRQSHSRPGLSTATATGANDRSFLARAPKAVLAAESRCGARQPSRLLVVAESIAARRQAELILGGDPGRGGPGSMPQTQISPHTQPTLHRTRHLRRAQSLGVSRTPASPRRDPGSAQHPSAGSPLLKRLPKTATSNESIASVLALAQATDMVLTSTPTSRVINTPSSSRDDPFQHTSYLKTQASISSLSGAGDDERSLSPQSVSLDLPRTSTDTNELEHAKSAEAIVVRTSSPPPVLERQDLARILRGNEVAKKCEEEALRRLNESLEKSHLVFGKLSTASPTELRQPPLSISTSSRSAEPYTHRRPTTMTANARRAQRQKQRAMEYLEVDDALQDDIDVEVEVAEPNVSDPTSSTHLRASSWVPPRGTVSSDDAEHKELSSDEASTKVDLEPLPGAMDLILCRTTADEAITPMSPASSSGASCTLESPHSLSTSSSRGQHVDLETTDEQRLWGTQLEADLAKRRRQGDNDGLSQTAGPLSISAHRRHRSGTIKAPALQSVNTSGVLNERVSAPTLYEQKLPASPLPVKPASFSSLPPQEQSAKATEAASLHAPTASFGLQRGSAIGSATSIASPAQVDSLLNQLRSSTSYCYESDGKRTSRSRRTAGQYCLFSFSKGMTLDENASLSSCRLRPFELLELHLHSTRHRVRLPRYHYTKSSAPHRLSGENLSRHTPSTAFGASPTSTSRPPQKAVAPPLLDCDYLDSFAHGWAYVHHPRGCPEKARAVGLGCWKLRWLVVHQGYLCVFRRRPDPANDGLVARGREQGGEKGEERTKAGSASPQGLIAKLNLSVISWISSELADGATNPVLRTLAQDLINVCFNSPSEHKSVGARSETGPGSHHHIVSLRFLTDHAARCWYALFQRVHCRYQLARRGDTLKLEELAKLPLRSNIDVFRGIADFLQQTEIDLPCPWDASVKVSVDDWRKRAYLRSLVAGRGGVVLPGRSGRGGGRNALLKTRVTPVGGNVDAEDADLWSDHSEEEGVFTVQGDAFVCTDPSSSTVAPGSLMSDLQGFPGEVVLQQRATSMEEAVTTSTLIGEAKATSLKKHSKRPSTQGDGTHRLFQLGIPHHKSAINMDPSSWFPPPPPPPDSGSTDSTYKALAMRRNSFANLAAAFVGGGRLSSSHGRRSGTGKKGPPALARPELTRLQTNSRGPSVDMAKRSHESATLPAELTVLSGDVTSASLRTTSLSAPIGMSTPLASTTTTSTSDSVTLEDSEAHTERLTAGENLATKLIVSDSQVENCSLHSSSSLTPRPRALVLMHLSEPQRIPTPSNGSPSVLKSLVSEASASRPSTPRVSGALSPLRTQTVDNSAASGEGSGSRSPLIPPRSPYRTSLGRRAVQAEHVAVTRAPANGHGESEGQERRPSLAELPFLVLETTASSSAVAVLASPFKHEPLAGSASPSAHVQTSAASASIPTATSQTTASLSHDASSPAAPTNQLTSQQSTNAPLSGVQMSQSPGPAATSISGASQGIDIGDGSPLISASSLLLEEFAQQKKRGRGWSLSRFKSKKG